MQGAIAVSARDAITQVRLTHILLPSTRNEKRAACQILFPRARWLSAANPSARIPISLCSMRLWPPNLAGISWTRQPYFVSGAAEARKSASPEQT